MFAALLLIQPDHINPPRRLITFCASLMIWSSLYLLGSQRGLPSAIAAYPFHQLLSTAAVLTLFTLVLALVPYFRTEDRIVTGLVALSPAALGAALLTIWLGLAFSPDLTMLPAGIATFVGMLLYAFFAFWSMITSNHECAPSLRIPGVVVILAVIADFVTPTRHTPFALFIFAVSALLIGWAVLRYQLLKPLSSISEELQVANRDLRQLVTEIASERAKNTQLVAQLTDSRQYGEYKSDFLNLLGHRLRTPLNSIVGYSELLETGVYGDLTSKQQDRVQKIHRNSDTLLQVINDMIDLNLLDAGQVSLKLHLVNLSALMQQAIRVVKPYITEKALHFRVDAMDDLPPVLADEVRLEQSFTYVLRYALQIATGEIHVMGCSIMVKNGVALEFALPLMGWLANGKWSIIEVKLQASSVNVEAQAHLFEAFFQPIQQEELGGTGLELTIAKKLIELHEGRLWTKSYPNGGLSFITALPVVDA